MTDLINIKLSDSWIGETSGYLPRIDTAIQLDKELEGVIRKNWLAQHCPGPEVSEASSIAIRIVLYANNLFSISFQSFPELKSLWASGQFVLVPLVTRYIYECWGAMHYARKTLQRLIAEGNIERETQRVNRLTFGARSEVKLPFGGNAEEQSINVLTFIQSLSDVNSSSEEKYAFLSEACHPNMFQSSYFQMAGPPLSNWENEKFKSHAHELLEKTVVIIEDMCNGIQGDLLNTLESGQEYVEEKG